MTAQHSRFAELATRLIAQNGRDVELVSFEQTGPDYQPVITETTTDAVAVQSEYRAAEIDGDLIRKNDRRYLIDAAVEITEDMRIRDDDGDFSIIDVSLIKPGTTSIMYKVQARS